MTIIHIQKKDVLILSLTDREDYALQEWKKNGVDTDITLKEQPKLIRALRRVWIRWGLPFESIWYGSWKKEFLSYSCVIVHGTWLAEKIPHWMRKKARKAGKNVKIIWWYWNTVDALSNPQRVSTEDCEKWSFDIRDCEKYNMTFNTQYYFKSFCLPQSPLESDVYFLGSDGGRKEMLLATEKELSGLGIKTDFNILVAQNKEAHASCITRKLSYTENLEHIAKSKAILEILREGQSGQTLRPLEALFFQRKLITNDSLIKEKEYYHPDNIFVLGEQDIEELPSFLERAYQPMPQELMDKYDCEQWLERMLK